MTSLPPQRRTSRAAGVALLIVLIAALRIAANWGQLPQAYDEPAHIVCGMEWLEQGTYTLEPLHPPLPRVLTATGPFLDGSRLPLVQTKKGKFGEWFDIFSGGTEILNGRGNYRRTLTLARLGELPLFILGCALVFTWARSLLGDVAAIIAVALWTLVPSVIAFATLAYVDFALAVLLPAMLWAFMRWLENPTHLRAAVFGFVAALAILSNFTVLLFGSVCLLGAFASWLAVGEGKNVIRSTARPRLLGLLLAMVVLSVTIWAGYRFSVRALNQTFQSAAVRQLPGLAQIIGLKLLQVNPPIPAPDLFKGLVSAFLQNQNPLPSYCLGQVRRGGFWYFYWLDLLLKTPLPILLLAAIGCFHIVKRRRDWRLLAIAGGILGVLVLSMTVKVNLGIRHILFIYPLLAIVGSLGVLRIWELRNRWRRLTPVFLAVLLAWLLVSSWRSQADPISYYNEFAGAHPENYFLFGCDFDCGQDVGRLSETLRRLGVTHWSGRLWTSADLNRMNLPPFEQLPPGQPATGWVVISVLHQRTANGIWNPRDLHGYQWLDSYQPVAYVGRTIRIYNIPPNDKIAPVSTPPSGKSAGEDPTQH